MSNPALPARQGPVQLPGDLQRLQAPRRQFPRQNFGGPRTSSVPATATTTQRS